jgi:branched-chain amino acid transport system substrate-binding protein
MMKLPRRTNLQLTGGATRRWTVTPITRLALCWLPFLCGLVSANAQPAVKIGLLIPNTGQFTDVAAQMENGIKLYMKEHGDIVAGKKIDLILKDTTGAPDIAKRLAQELIVNQKVDILAGFALTPEALAVGELSAEAKKFMVVMNAATAIITTKSPYMTRTSYTLPQNCEQLARWAYANGVRRVYTMVADYGAGHDAEAAFQHTFKEAGGQIIGSIRMAVANPDFSAYVQRARDAKPEGIFVFVPGGAQPTALAKALIERGVDPTKIKLMGQGELTDESALSAMGDAAIGIITAYHYNHTHNSDMNAAFVKAYNAEFKRNPDTFSVGAYDGMHVIYEALKKTGGKTDAESLIAAAKGLKWESPRGVISIDPETRDIVNTIYIWRVEKAAGRVENVEIEKYETVKDPVKAQIK